jgi:hypothetical protein
MLKSASLLGDKHMADQLDRLSRISNSVIFFILPAAILGILALALFFDFLGTQATEIAKLINEIEIQCKADFWNAIGLMPALDPGVTGNVTCGAYLPKVILFFVLLAFWGIIANVITLKLFEAVQPRGLRFTITVAVTLMLPAILLYKYITVLTASGGSVFSSFPFFTLLVILETALILAVFARRFFRDEDFSTRPGIILAIFIGSIAVFLIASLLFAYYPANLFNAIGSINTIVLYVVLAYAFVGGLFYYGRATRIPFAALLLVWVFGINALGLNSTHTVPARDVSGPQFKDDEQLIQWLQARRDAAAFTTKEYPVYIVAASGGGIYAAIRTAYFLDFLQQKCPAFAHHIFAISGVSGGGLGALAFASQQQSLEAPDLTACDPAAAGDPASRATPILDDFFSKDLISTIVGAGLFPDMLQRVLPWPVPSLDRSRAFRKALGENWGAALGMTAEKAPAMLRKVAPLRGQCATASYFSDCEINAYWTPAGDVPALAFNATEVDSGSPVVLSNLDPLFYANSLAARNSPNFANRSIHLVDGASLSARFPIALPAGFLAGFNDGNILRLVDGGYFDGSGLTTAQAMKLALEEIATARTLRIKVRIIYLGEKVPSVYDLIAMNRQEGVAPMPPAPSTPRGAELTAHARALFQARDQRSAETLRQTFKIDPTLLRFQWDPAVPPAADTPCSNIPLAWYLAPCTQRVLKQRLQNAILESAENFETLRQDLVPQ